MAARDERRVTANTEMVDDGERIVGETAPRVRVARRVGCVAVTMTPKVERPDAPAARHQPHRARCPDPTVEAGRMHEQDGRAGAPPVVHDERAGGPIDGVRTGDVGHRRASSQPRYVARMSAPVQTVAQWHARGTVRTVGGYDVFVIDEPAVRPEAAPVLVL